MINPWVEHVKKTASKNKGKKFKQVLKIAKKSYKKMNKKAAGFMTHITSSMVFAIIVLIIFLIFGAGGGFKTTWDIGSFVSKIPVWFWIVIGVLWFASQLRGK